MSSHNLAIAKAALAAGLLRPDPQAISRDDIAQFHALLSQVTAHCSSANVQKCKRWIASNILQSKGRCTALGKYMTALSSSFSTAQQPGSESVTASRQPSTKRRRLHLLYLLNDVLHHAQTSTHDLSVSGKFQPVLVDLFSSAATFTGCPKHQRKLLNLLEIWHGKGYYSEDYIGKLRETIRSAADGELDEKVGGTTSSANNQGGIKAKNVPFVMPAMHGDSNTPWYDLPAGNLMPHIIPNSVRPINPSLIKPLQLVAGPADSKLVDAVKSFLADVDNIFGTMDIEQVDEASLEVDELGQAILRDEITGEILEGEGYYGWSRHFCEKMKRRRRGLDLTTDRGDSRSRSRSRSRSSSIGNVGFKRRRYSSSEDDRSRSRSRSRNRRRRTRSISRSRSPSRERERNVKPDRSPSYSPSLDDRNSSMRKQDAGPPNRSSIAQSGFQIPGPPNGRFQPYQRPVGMSFVPPPPPPPPPQQQGNYINPYAAFVPPPPQPYSNGQQSNQYGNFNPPPPPIPGQWQPPFPLPPQQVFNAQFAPPPPPFPPQQNNQWQQNSFNQPPGPPNTQFPQPSNQNQGGERGGHGNQGRGNYGGRGNGNYRGRGW